MKTEWMTCVAMSALLFVVSALEYVSASCDTPECFKTSTFGISAPGGSGMDCYQYELTVAHSMYHADALSGDPGNEEEVDYAIYTSCTPSCSYDILPHGAHKVTITGMAGETSTDFSANRDCIVGFVET